MNKIALLAILLVATGVWAQDGVFSCKDQRGRSVHMLPSLDALERHYGRKPTFARPSDKATVYPESYGTGNLISHGGKEMSNAGFQAIYWNSSVATSSDTSNGFATIQNEMDAFVQAFADNQNWDNSGTDDYTIIQQYGTTSPIAPTLGLNQANPAGGAFIDTQTTLPGIDDVQIQPYIASLLTAGKLQANSQIIYGVFFPAGTIVTVSGITSCVEFCAYHSSFAYNGTTIVYAVFPYPNCGGCSLGTTAADMLTMFIGHEVRESVTDAYGAWTDSGGYEADDKCAWSNLYYTSNGNFFVQPEFSNGGAVTASGFTATYPGPGCIVPSTSCNAPSAPTGLNPSAGNGQVLLNWSSVSGATSYNVKRGTTPGGETTIASPPTNSFVDTGLTNGTTYYYVVSAVANCGANPESGNSNEVSAKPVAPVQPDFTLTAAPSSRTVTQGSQTTYTVTVSALNGFTAAVGLSAAGLPSGVTASFNPVSINGSGSSTLTLTASASAALGTVNITITGTSGALVHSTTPALTVTSPPPDFTIAAAPGSRTVQQGSQTTYTVTIGALNSFAAAVGLSAAGLPSGVTASFNPTSINGAGSSTLTLTASAGATLGTVNITITGTSGALVHSATPALTVAATPDFTISASPSSQTVVQGTQTTYTVTIAALNGFTGTAALSAAGLPSGVTASFNPTSINGAGSSTLTLTASASAALGAVSITITGTSGALVHSAMPSLTVNPPPPDFTISATPGLRSITRSSSTNYSVTYSPLNGFAGTVNLSVSGLPNGTRSGFQSISGTNSSMTITAGSRAVRGVYTLTIKGTSGSLSHSTQVQLIIR